MDRDPARDVEDIAIDDRRVIDLAELRDRASAASARARSLTRRASAIVERSRELCDRLSEARARLRDADRDEPVWRG